MNNIGIKKYDGAVYVGFTGSEFRTLPVPLLQPVLLLRDDVLPLIEDQALPETLLREHGFDLVTQVGSVCESQ